MRNVAVALAVLLLACSKKPPSAEPGPAASNGQGAKNDGAKNYTLDVKAGECKASGECSVTLKLLTGGEFHVNEEYPYKFVAAPAADVTYLGKQDPNTFSRAAGDFRTETPQTATMTVRFRPQKAGDVQVQGSYKLSVCSKDACQIDTAAVNTRVSVLPST